MIERDIFWLYFRGLELTEDKQPHEEQTFMVFESSLLELFKTCSVCFGQCHVTLKQWRGCAVTVEQVYSKIKLTLK